MTIHAPLGDVSVGVLAVVNPHRVPVPHPVGHGDVPGPRIRVHHRFHDGIKGSGTWLLSRVDPLDRSDESAEVIPLMVGPDAEDPTVGLLVGSPPAEVTPGETAVPVVGVWAATSDRGDVGVRDLADCRRSAVAPRSGDAAGSGGRILREGAPPCPNAW